MQNHDADTEWNDILRQKNVIPPKEAEITEDEVINLLEHTVTSKLENTRLLEDCTLEELNEREDEDDEREIEKYRKLRLAEIKAAAKLAKFGDVREISAEDYVTHVTNAGADTFVVLHLYKPGIPLCTLINSHIGYLASNFPSTKFLKSVSTTCIPNYPDRSLPTIFVYCGGKLKQQFIGQQAFGEQMSCDELEWMLHETGAIKSQLEKKPEKVKKTNFTFLSGKQKVSNSDDDEDDW